MGTPADAGDVPTGPRPAPCLPEPTGPGPVGTTSLWLTDTSRPDPWAAGVNARELMVSLWYPATPTGSARALPLVVLSPGFPSPRSTLTALAEDLASHGYIVTGIDHTYESFATAFPDGQVTTCHGAGTGLNRGSPAGEPCLRGHSGSGRW